MHSALAVVPEAFAQDVSVLSFDVGVFRRGLLEGKKVFAVGVDAKVLCLNNLGVHY